MTHKDLHLPSFNILAWEAWCQNLQTKEDWTNWANSTEEFPGLTSEESITISPSISFLPIAYRKKLSLFTKLNLYLLNQLTKSNNISDSQIIISSRHGEAQTTVGLLDAIAISDECSPMAFSRSVLNAAIGLHSIVTNNTTASVAISGMEDSFFGGMIEAIARSFSLKQSVVYLWCDDKIPRYFTNYINDPISAVGIAFIIDVDSSQLTSNHKLEIEAENLKNPFYILRRCIHGQSTNNFSTN